MLLLCFSLKASATLEQSQAEQTWMEAFIDAKLGVCKGLSQKNKSAKPAQ
jgi:hypothetical protein